MKQKKFCAKSKIMKADLFCLMTAGNVSFAIWVLEGKKKERKKKTLSNCLCQQKCMFIDSQGSFIHKEIFWILNNLLEKWNKHLKRKSWSDSLLEPFGTFFTFFFVFYLFKDFTVILLIIWYFYPCSLSVDV